METLPERLDILFKHKINQYQVIPGTNNEQYLSSENETKTILTLLYHDGFSLIDLFCVEHFQKQKGLTLFYVFEKNTFQEFLIVSNTIITTNETFSVATIYPSACWLERKISDGFGITFQNAFDTRRLFLHEPYPSAFHPLRKKTSGRIPIETTPIVDDYEFKKVHGEGVYQIPVGPVHAGIIEPGHFRFNVIGETIFNLEIRLFYKHRGIEKLAEQKPPAACIKIAEAISGDESAANAVAFCIGVEKISNIEPPERALYLRTILLELERIYSHLSDLAGMIVDVAAPVYASPFFVLREELFRLNEQLTGSRFLRGIITIGGLTNDITADQLQQLNSYLPEFLQRFNKAIHQAREFPLIIDRMEKTGVIKQDLCRPLALSGPTARASGNPVDVRIDHPYGAYRYYDIQRRIRENGDILSRFDIKTTEIKDSLDLLLKLLRDIPSGSVHKKASITDGCALSVVESARGQNIHWVCIQKGVIDRYSVRTASFCNWQAIEHAVLDCIVADFPLLNKSLNLSYAGADL